MRFGALMAGMGDMHLPFVHVPTVNHFFRWCNQNQPKNIIQVGDLHDMFSSSRFPRKIIINPYEEMKQSRTMAVSFWETLRRLCPKSRLIQILGNHDIRVEKRVIEKCPEAHPFVERGLVDHYSFDGVETYMDPREELIIDGINITHGHRKHGDHMTECMRSTILGHTHIGGTVFQKLRNELMWELNCGFAADVMHEALKYTPKSYVKWTLGFGVVDELGPRFIPWDGKNK